MSCEGRLEGLVIAELSSKIAGGMGGMCDCGVASA